jgi:hypothetical protein
MKPPTMTLAPLGIMATASSAETAFMFGSDVAFSGKISRWAAARP